MDTESHYSLLREKLDALGFHQPLPIGSLTIVSALLNDLVLTTKNFKNAKTQIEQLNKEKAAWELGVEPYKCDNSKLLAECNGLHLAMVKQCDSFEAQINDLKKTIRDLQLDKQYLDEQCIELRNTVAELEQMIDDPRYRKNRTNRAVQKRKPFISTVRSGDFPALPPLPVKGDGDHNSHSAKCSHSTRKECQCLAAEYEHNNVQTQLELIALYKQQLERRNNEISRLNRLLIGGRPVTALAKDCCFNGVGSLTHDIDAMQLEMSELHQRYEEAVQNQHEAEKRAISLKAENELVAKELRELKEVALGVETDANSALGTLRQQNNQLKMKLYETKKSVRELETKMDKMKKQNEYARSQVRSLQTIIDRTCGKEEELKSMVVKLSKQIDEFQSKKTHSTHATKERINAATMTQVPLNDDNALSIDVSRLKADREFYQREYLKLKSRQFDEVERHRMSKCRCNAAGHEALCCMQRPIIAREQYQCCECWTNARDCPKATGRCDHEQQQIEQLKQKIRELESENKSLHASHAPNKSMVNLLKEELSLLRARVDELTAEKSRLEISYNQLKILQKRTESNLIDHESQLKHHARQLSNAASQLTLTESCRREVCHEIRDLKTEINRLSATNECLQKEKDHLIMKLDAKTEKVCLLETKLESLRDRLTELNCQADTANRHLETANSEKRKNDDSVRKLNAESDTLRAQIDQLKRINENAMAENRRLTNELVDSECTNCLHKTKLIEAEKEVEQLKNQLQQYVQEVQRAEDLLLRKESERDEMLELYKTLSQDAMQLEENNHSLEIEVVERKRSLCDVESKLSHFSRQLTKRELELSDAMDEIAKLKDRIEEMERTAERVSGERDKAKRELEALRELCSKLEIEKEKLNAEVNEYAEIRRELERENDKLRNELMQKELCDEWNKTQTTAE